MFLVRPGQSITARCSNPLELEHNGLGFGSPESQPPEKVLANLRVVAMMVGLSGFVGVSRSGPPS